MFRLHQIRLTLVATSCAAVWLTPQLSLAQQQASESTPWEIGLGVASQVRPYTGEGSKTIPFPELSYENQYVRIDGISADAKLGSTGPFSFALRGTYALADGYKASDAPILFGMQTRDASLWLGPAMEWKTDAAKVSLSVLGDTFGNSKGVRAKLGVEHDFHLGSFMFTPHAGAEYLDKNYVDYYYGVTASEANALRPAYEGKSTTNFEVGLRSIYTIDSRSSIYVDLSAKSLGAGITDSPIVSRKVVPTIVAGYAYRFGANADNASK